MKNVVHKIGVHLAEKIITTIKPSVPKTLLNRVADISTINNKEIK